MFVVHTVNQLEEAVRVGAEEILVTGGLASNVQEAYMLKSCKEENSCIVDVLTEDGVDKIERLAEKSGIPAWRISSILIITGGYTLLDVQQGTRSPTMILQKTIQH